MSVVTGIMLCTRGAEPEENLQRIDDWLRERGFTALNPVDEQCCNGKHPQMHMRGGGYNHFPNDDFVEFVSGLVWEYPENVVLVLQPEDGSTRVLRNREGN